MTKLRLNAVIIEETKEGKNIYNTIGSAFAHPDGNGFDLALKAIPANGELSLFFPKDNEEDTLGLAEEKYLPVYIVESQQREDGTWDNFRTPAGAAFPHKNDRGINVSLKSFPLKPDLKLVIRTKRTEQAED